MSLRGITHVTDLLEYRKPVGFDGNGHAAVTGDASQVLADRERGRMKKDLG